MLFKRVITLILIALFCVPVQARLLRGSSVLSINRILIVLYGQSNNDIMTTSCDAPCTPPDPPAAATGTQYYNGSTLTTVPNANGIRVLQNNVTQATGLPTVSFQCSVGGSNLANLTSGAGPCNGSSGPSCFASCVSQVNSIIAPQDKVFIVWDQGEGDANGAEVPDYYAPTLVQLHRDMVAAIGRTVANTPFLTTQKGTASGLPGSAAGGTTQASWQTVKNAQVWAPFYEAGGNMIFSHTDVSYTRGDGYHYEGLLGMKPQAQRFAQSINTLMGAASGFPKFDIASSSTVDATHTAVAVTQNLGTDFTPTSGITSFEVSGDNGANWINAVGSRTDATHISLLHSSLTTTNARLVRYLYGFSPPDVNINCDSALGAGPCNPPSALVLDNSSLTIPLTPTTWNLRPTPTGSTLPMPTWRDTNTAAVSTVTQSVSGLQLGLEGVRQFLILSLANIDLSFSPIQTMTITPQDFLGNAVGSTVTLSFPVTIAARAGNVAILGVPLNADNHAATTFKIDVSYCNPGCTVPQNPFGNTIFNVWTVPFADLNSTTPTAGSNTASSAATVTTTLNTSAGGLTACSATNTTSAAQGSFSGSISGTVLTAGASSKTFAVGQFISSGAGGGFGPPANATPNLTITSLGTGTGGAGTYNLSGPSQTVSPAQTMVNATAFPVPSSSSGENFGLRWGAAFAVFDAANSAGSTPASATITFNDAGTTLNLACASWR